MAWQNKVEQETMNNARRRFRSITFCAPLLLLTGCVGWQRNSTWDRVTDPDYVPTEQRMQHGFHRTTWSEWSESAYPGSWRRDGVREAEPIPRGRSKSDLPSPSTAPADTGEGDAPPADVEEGFVPQASSTLHRLVPLRGHKKTLVTQIERLPDVHEGELVGSMRHFLPIEEGNDVDFDGKRVV
jgi:hypothetical protein